MARDDLGYELNVMWFGSYIMEYIVGFDLFLDLLVTYHLIISPNVFWATGTVLAMIAPMYACLMQMMEFLRMKNMGN